MLEFTVIGDPATKGSVTAHLVRKKGGGYAVNPQTGRPVVIKHDDSGAKGKSWAGAVSGTAFEAMVEQDVALVRDVPLVIEVEFFKPRPKGHFRTGRNAHLLKPGMPAAPCTKPDVDKYLRAILDALKNVVYADDGQVAAVQASKNFGEPARAVIRVRQFIPAERESAPSVDDAPALFAA